MTVVADCLLVLGGLNLLMGALGLLRFPDFYSRTHAASMTDTAGAGFILLGLALYAGASLVAAKLLMILLFMLITAPTAAHALAQATLADGHEPNAQHKAPGP